MTAEERRPVLAARIRAERKKRRWDVPEMARRLSRAAGDTRSALTDHDVLVGYVRRWEGARAGISERFRMLYAAAFELAEDDLFGTYSVGHEDNAGAGLPTGGWTQEDNAGLAQMLSASAYPAASPQQIAHEWLVTESPPVCQVRSGRRIGGGLLTEIEARVGSLRQLDDVIGGEDLRDVAAAELVATAALLREASYSEQDGRRLLAAFADLCQIGGWIASDAGVNAVAERRYLTGVRAAFAAGDRSMAANLLSSLSYQVANVGDPRDAVLLALSAQTGAARDVTPLMRALLAERAAWSYARLPGGRGSADCERALGRGGCIRPAHSGRARATVGVLAGPGRDGRHGGPVFHRAGQAAEGRALARFRPRPLRRQPCPRESPLPDVARRDLHPRARTRPGRRRCLQRAGPLASRPLGQEQEPHPARTQPVAALPSQQQRRPRIRRSLPCHGGGLIAQHAALREVYSADTGPRSRRGQVADGFDPHSPGRTPDATHSRDRTPGPARRHGAPG